MMWSNSRGCRIPVVFAAERRLTIGLLNNMPDSALMATERQFAGLLRVAAGDVDIRLKLFSLEGVRRGERAQADMADRYESADRLPNARLDALIVTGAEPRAADLEDEPFWPALARVIDWTREAEMPTVWSCLAAHAAVLRLDGIRRVPLPAKLSGVFASRAASDDPLLAGAPTPFITPHSRQNGLDEEQLVRAGYRILTGSAKVGVDAFVRREGGPSLFLQGHPEYDADTLMREYGRDVGRFLRRQRPTHPTTPASYFDRPIANGLAVLAEHATAHPDPAFMELFAEMLAKAAPTRIWRTSAVRLYRNWLDEVAARAAAQGDAARSRNDHSFAHSRV